MIPTDSPEWAWRTIQWLKSAWSRVDDDHRLVAGVIDEIEQARAWERWPQDRPYGSLPKLIEAELGISFAEVQGRIAAAARERIRQATEAATGKVLPKGKVNQYAPSVPQITEPQRVRAARAGVGTRTQEKIDRLARDFPVLHEQVKAGALSVNAAAIEAGFVLPTWTAPTDPVALARAVKRRLAGDDLAAFLADAVHRQRDRRNLSRREIARVVAELDRLKPRGNPEWAKPPGDDPLIAHQYANSSNGKSATETAAIVGVSTRTGLRTRAIVPRSTPATAPRPDRPQAPDTPVAR